MAAPLQGAAIFSSQSEMVAVEALEQRTHFAATPLSAYYPLAAGSQWVYHIVDDGQRRTDTETISSGMKRMHAQMVWQRLIDSSDGSHEVDYENFSTSGQIQLHGVGDDSTSLIFGPAIVFPKWAKVGQRTVMSGKVDSIDDSGRRKGTYRSEVKILGAQRVRVRAGTFNCLKVQFTIDFSVKWQNVSAHVIHTQTAWMAKGVGNVKWIETDHIETTDNGRHTTDDGVAKSSLSSYSIAAH